MFNLLSFLSSVPFLQADDHNHDHAHDHEHDHVEQVVDTHSHSHSYEDFGTFWAEFTGVLLDPAHIFAELVFTIVFDGIILYLGYQVFFKRIILPRIRKQIHKEVDEEHGVLHDEETGEVTHVHHHHHKKDGSEHTCADNDSTDVGSDSEPKN
jgi:hypothetical protein